MTVTLAHGGGGRALRALLESHVGPAVGMDALRHDAAVLDGRIAMTTDAFVVHPLTFPGGDIGRLAVCGTVNDLAMAGAVPYALSLALILEEGLPLEVLDRILASAAEAAREAGVRIVTGDTKVVERGRGDGVYVTTTGIGHVPEGVDVGPHRIRPGDAVLVSGDVGRHGAAVLSVREGLGFDDAVGSDVAPVAAAVAALLAEVDVHCLRDPTRGGVAAVLDELATGHDIAIDEAAVPVHDGVRAATELFGLDPLHLACEGRFVAFVMKEEVNRAVDVLRTFGEAAEIGRVQSGPGRVWIRDSFGGERLLVRPWGDPLPRIC
ncbi:MAG: hydrogenase expression/formation protein HypE [Alphaproteobacteria bacterium]|nr:hydrogenase expression/formation protein HypE [Alphaproteobacteria bacterium]